MPISSMTGAGHSKNVFSTPAGFSSEKKVFGINVHSFKVDSSVFKGEDKCSYTDQNTENDPTGDRQVVFTLKHRNKQSTCELTDCNCVVDFEAAEHLVDISGMEETVSSHHHLKRLWLQDTH